MRRHFVDQLRHPDAALDRGIVFEGHVRRALQAELAREARLDDGMRGLEARFRSLPRTDTNTLASRRSGETETPVIVTRPILGSFSVPTASATTARTDSFTRRMRSLIALRYPRSVGGRDERPVGAHELPLLAGEPRLGACRELLRVARLARDERRGQRTALPEVVVVHLGDGGAEPVGELRLRRLHVLPLALERPRVGEVQLDGENRDEAAAAYDSSADAPAGTGCSSDVRSTSRVS